MVKSAFKLGVFCLLTHPVSLVGLAPSYQQLYFPERRPPSEKEVAFMDKQLAERETQWRYTFALNAVLCATSLAILAYAVTYRFQFPEFDIQIRWPSN